MPTGSTPFRDAVLASLKTATPSAKTDNTQNYIEIAKILLQIFFAIAAMQNLTPEESEALYQAEKLTFLSNKPELLPDV